MKRIKSKKILYILFIHVDYSLEIMPSLLSIFIPRPHKQEENRCMSKERY
jgi:hypothetical protein